jgi:hypothetical protein
MELLRHEQLGALIEPVEGPCVSVFLPTHRLGVEVRQGPIRLKNQLKQIEAQLEARKLRTAAIREFLAPIQKLAENSGFWQYQSDGLAIFRSQDKFYYYRLPMHVDELLVVTDRFHVKPLLRLFTEDGRYYLLSLSKKEIRFFQCTRYGARIVELPAATPRSLEQVLELAGVEKQRQVHASLVHGHGGGSEDNKEDLRQFFRMVDKGVHEVLRDDHAPLVLAGVEYLFPLYREVNTYGHLMDRGVTGNPDGRRPEDLQSNAWAVVEPQFRKARSEAAARFERHAGSARSSKDIRKVVPAAAQGRVDQLFVAVGRQMWGRWDQDSQEVTVSEEKAQGDRDLLNFTAIHTLLQGGAVYAVAPGEVPGGGLLAAVFRY